MRSVNKVILIGNLTRDPELRQTPNGQYVCTFGIATNRVWVTSDGQRQSSTEFHELVAWARLAEICQQNLNKGKLIYIEGYLKTRSWDTPEGVKRFKTEIIIQDLIILEKRQRTEEFVPSVTEEKQEETSPSEKPQPSEVKMQEERVEAKPKPQKSPSRKPRTSKKLQEAVAVPAMDLGKQVDIDADLGL